MIIVFDVGWVYLVVFNKGVWLFKNVSFIGIFLCFIVLVLSGFIIVEINYCILKWDRVKRCVCCYVIFIDIIVFMLLIDNRVC